MVSIPINQIPTPPAIDDVLKANSAQDAFSDAPSFAEHLSRPSQQPSTAASSSDNRDRDEPEAPSAVEKSDLDSDYIASVENNSSDNSADSVEDNEHSPQNIDGHSAADTNSESAADQQSTEGEQAEAESADDAIVAAEIAPTIVTDEVAVDESQVNSLKTELPEQTETIETTPATTPDESLDLPPETAESSELDSPDKPSTEAIALPNDGARNGEKEAGAQPATDVALVPEQTGVESALEAATTPELKADSEAAESEETEATRVRIEKSAHLASAASSGENSQIEADSSATRTAPQSPPDAAGEGTSPAEIGNEAPRDDSNHQQRRDARNPRASEASKVAETTTPDKVEPAAGLTTELGKASSTSQQATENGNNAPIAPAEFGPSAKIAQTLLGKSVQRGTGDGTNLQGAEQARLINRVARAMTSAHDQGAPLRIRLSPPELGSIRLEIKVQDGALSARIEAETPAARAALLENVNDLRQRLAEQGIRIEQFDVDLNDQQGSGELPENVNHERDGDRPQDRNEDESRNATEIPSTHETKSDDQQLEGDSKLNVII